MANVWVADWGLRGKAEAIGEYPTFNAAFRALSKKLTGLERKASLLRYWRAFEGGFVAEIYMEARD